MGTLIVEFVNEGIELRLLLKEVGTCGSGSFHFQGSMHAFVATVLLRMARPDTFDGNAEAKPPNGQPAQVEEAVG